MNRLSFLIIYFICINFYSFSVLIEEITEYYEGLGYCPDLYLYDSIKFSCFKCNYTEIDGICYSNTTENGDVSNIYVDGSEIEVIKYNDSLPRKLTRFDKNGNLLQYAMDARTNPGTYSFSNTEFDSYFPTSSQSYSSVPFRKSQNSESIEIPELADHDKFFYYFHACYYGLVIQYCQFLANLCALSIYDSDYYACIAIDIVNRKIIENRNTLFGGDFDDYSSHLIRLEKYINTNQMKNEIINRTQTSLYSDDNSNYIYQLDLYLAK